MTIDVADRVRRAIDDIIDPAAELGRCPTPGTAEIAVQTKVSVDSSSGWLQLVGRSRTLPARRFAVVAAGLLLVVGSLAIVLRAQQRDTATTAASGLIDLGSVERYPIGSVTFVDEPPLFVVNDASTGIVVLDARSTHLGCVVVVDDPETAAELGAGIDGRPGTARSRPLPVRDRRPTPRRRPDETDPRSVGEPSGRLGRGPGPEPLQRLHLDAVGGGWRGYRGDVSGGLSPEVRRLAAPSAGCASRRRARRSPSSSRMAPTGGVVPPVRARRPSP